MPTSVLRAAQSAGCFVAVLTLSVASCQATSPTDVVEIEEHWQLLVGGPDSGRSSPQVTMVMSPESHTDNGYFVITLNHWTYPTFEPGGIQVQHWSGDTCLTAKALPAEQPLHHNGETVSWVQRMSLQDGVLTFEVVDGDSESWGSFGSDGDLRVSASTSLTKLNRYRPAVSVGESGIGYAGNRVSSLVLTKLTWKTAGGDEGEMVAPIDIDSDLDP